MAVRDSTCAGYGCDGNCGWRVLIRDIQKDREKAERNASSAEPHA